MYPGVCMLDRNNYYSGFRVDHLIRLVALRHHGGRVGGLIPGMGNVNTVTMAPNVGSSGL